MKNLWTDENGRMTAYGASVMFDVLEQVREIEAERAEKRRKMRCPDCGEVGERKGHQTCRYPQN